MNTIPRRRSYLASAFWRYASRQFRQTRSLAIGFLLLPATCLSAAQLTLTWNNNAADALGFVIQRSDNGGAFAQIASVNLASVGLVSGGPTLATYVDSTITAGENYSYQVAAFNSVGNSAFSNVATNAPTITTAPVSQTIAAFSSAVFTVAASGVPSPTFAWQFNGTPLTDGNGISGSSTATLTVAAASSLSAGMYTVVASNGIAPSASSSATLTVNEAAQSITLSLNNIITYSPGLSYDPGATATSGLPVVYTSSNSNVAVTSGGILSIVGAGTTTITASQPGNVNYLPATSATQNLTVNRAGQTITFAPVPASSSTWAPVVLNATASSGLPITFTSENPSVATVNGNIVTILATGSNFVHIDANQDGNTNYLPAAQATQIISILLAGYPQVTSQPSSQSVVAGTTISFTSSATGTPTPNIQWQVSTNNGVNWTTITDGPINGGIYPHGGVYSGTGTAVLTITAPNLNLNGYLYQYIATNSAGSATSNSASLTVTGSPPVFGTQPSSTTVVIGNTATFTAAATGLPTPTLQWQVSINGGANWTPLTNGGVYSGVTTGTLTITNPTLSYDSYQYQLVATNAVTSTNSNPATLTVNAPPAFAAQPTSSAVLAGATATFTATVSGKPTPTLQWQINNGGTWTNLTNGGNYAGVTTSTLTITNSPLGFTGNQYQLVATNVVSTVSSNPVTLTVSSPPSFTSQPTSATVVAGVTATFTASATGQPSPSLQWQVSINGGSNWTPLTNGSQYSGVTTGTLTITNPTFSLNSYQYQLVATNAVTSTNSNPATLTVNAPPAFAAQPTSSAVLAGATATFTATVSGEPTPTLQWQINDGGTWTNLTNGGNYAGVTTSTLTITNSPLGFSGNQYQLVATNVVSAVSSNPVTLTVSSPPSFTSQPTSTAVVAGATATFTAASTGQPAPSLQWQVSINGGPWTSLTNSAPYSGVTTGALTITNTTLGLSGYQYQLLATNAVTTTTSSPVTLTVNGDQPTFSTQPVATSVTVGSSATLTAAATGEPTPTFQWQVYQGNTWINLTNGASYSGVTTGTLTILNAALILNSSQYQVIATNDVSSATSNVAILTVNSAPPTFTTQPADVAITIGGSATFTGAASGLPAPTLQWMVSTDGHTWNPLTNSGIYSGVTTATLSITSPPITFNSYQYELVATNLVTTTTSSPAVLTVNGIAPVITTQPTSQTTATVGTTVIFTVAASGNPTPTYQWQKGGIALTDGGEVSGSITANLTLTGIGPSDAGTYTATATNVAGTSAASSGAVLTVILTPTITSSTTASGTVGTGFAFTLSAAGTPLSFTAIELPPGLTVDPSSGIISGTPTTAGIYNVQVSGTNASGTGSVAILTITINAAVSPGGGGGGGGGTPIVTAPTISTQPSTQSVAAGSTVTFTVVAASTATLSYQWNLAGTAIAGATNPTLTVTNVQAANAGIYTVVVTNSGGSITSQNATLSVITPPLITTPPSSQSVTAGTTVTFNVTATGASTYQWLFNGSPITGATGASYTINLAAAANSGSYTVTATNLAGSTTSSGAVLAVAANGAPAIATQPQSLTVATGASVVVSVTSSGTVTVDSEPTSGVHSAVAEATSYQWYLNGVPVAGATNASFLIQNLSASNAGSYTCLVTNAAGSSLSQPAMLSVTTTSNPGRLINLSLLSNISSSLTMGLVVGGSGTSGPEPLLIRAIGPSIGSGTIFGVPGVLSDPVLSLVQQNSQTVLSSNSGWGVTTTNSNEVQLADAATGAFPLTNTASHDAAMVTSLASVNGGYSVVVDGQSHDSGSALTEIYDATQNYTLTSTRLINLSCLAQIAAGGSLDVGFVVGGSTAKTVLVRASGPALNVLFGVGGVMATPQMQLSALSNSSAILSANAGWGGDSIVMTAAGSVGAFAWPSANSADSALVVSLAPGNYTVQVSSTTGAGGTVLVEIYDVQ